MVARYPQELWELGGALCGSMGMCSVGAWGCVLWVVGTDGN